jgi:NADPH:quinone reductase-like Zn-dependent oxidoreductase
MTLICGKFSQSLGVGGANRQESRLVSSDNSSRATGLWVVAPRQAELREEPLPERRSGEVVARALHSLVSAGSEMNVYRGEVASELEVAFPTRKGVFPFPIQFSYQVVAEVEAADPSSTFTAGDLVFCQHPHQDRFVVAEEFVHPLPEGLSARVAAFSNLANVALCGLLDVPVRLGDCCVVSGLGVIGTFVGHFARRTAGTLILVDPVESRRQAAAGIGADAVVALTDVSEVVEALSQGRGADVYIEVSGAPAALQMALDVTGVEGTVTVLSYYGSREATLRLSPQFHLRRQRIVSSMVGLVGSGLQPRWDKRRRMQAAMRLLQSVDVEAMITHEFDFADAPQAYALIDERPHETLGVLLNYPERGGAT